MGNSVTAVSSENIYQAFLVMLRGSSVNGILGIFIETKHVICYCEIS